MISLKILVKLQLLFTAMSVIYLLISLWRKETIGEPLSAAAIWPSIILFVLYSFSLLLAKLPNKIWYSLSMILAIIFFGLGGVLGNIYHYFDSGSEEYASITAWLLAVLINAFGTFLNIIALLGRFNH